MFESDHDELFFAEEEDTQQSNQTIGSFWKILIVDDEPEVHEITKMALNNFQYDGKKLKFISAYSGTEAKKMVSEHTDTVLVLLDIVMEEDNSGLQVVEHIRKTLNNKTVRIVLRTGQPGYAPERDVIINYDINDYKEKSELTAQKLFTSVVAAIRSYSDLLTIQKNAQERERIEGELKIAREIQASSMPRNFPMFPERNEFDIHALMVPAYEVGGDFYDIFFINEENLCLFIGDVSGKGIGSALFMMQCMTLMRSEAMRGASPHETLRQANDFLCSSQTSNLFATVFIAFLNIKTGRLVFSNAGHNPPFIQSENDSYEPLELPSGLPLNLFSDSDYVSYTKELTKGNILFGYTDGITEAHNTKEELFTEKKLLTLLNSSESSDPQSISLHILGKIKEHSDKTHQSDDITIVTLKFGN